MTFLEIQQAIYRKVGFLDAPESTVQTRVKQTLNIWHRRLIARFPRLRDDTISFSTVIGQTVYALPQAIARINGIHETTTPMNLEECSIEWIRRTDPQLVAIGPPQKYAPQSYRYTAMNPASTGIWAVSSSASDTVPTINIDGSIADGTRTALQSVALTGTSRVQIGSMTNFTEIDRCFLSAACVGTVTLYDASTAGNVIATIRIGATTARYLWVLLWPQPGTVITEYVDYTRQISDMVQDTDEPLLPEDFQSILIDAGAMEEWLRKNDTRAKDEKQLMDEQLRKLQHWVVNPPGYHPIVAKTRRGFSRLGGNYPADTWR